MPGPPPTPTRVKAMRGSWRANSNPTEPTPTMRAPPMPATVPKPAKPIWRRVIRELKAMGLLAESDRMAIARYCEWLVEWLRARDALAGEPQVLPTQSGGKVNPYINVMVKCEQWLHKFEGEFGLSPSARTRIAMADQPEPRADDEVLLRIG